MLMTDIIEKKRDKLPLTPEELEFFISGVTDKSIPNYQISALLMAILLNGMDSSEILTLTTLMAKSGDMLDLSDFPHTVDKHSTGGVGDKTTLIVAPIAAALGCTVAKMSGRGLGFTGGTVDKLESISGYKTSLENTEFKKIAREYGMCVTGQSGNFAPADKRLYAIRDVTATVNSIPLIASSIMSKKLASGAETIVLDVKFGSGAFMKTPEDAEKLAREMVTIGKGAGRKTAAIITNMNTPLGFAIGNALEVKEAVKVLRGEGDETLTNLCVILAAKMYEISFGVTEEESLKRARQVIADGSAFNILCKVVKAQGGDEKLLTGEHKFTEPDASLELLSPTDGYITAMNSEMVGKAAAMTGAGREKLDDILDYSAGIVLSKKYGDYVKKGEKLATLYGKGELLKSAKERLIEAYKIENSPRPEKPIVYKIIE